MNQVERDLRESLGRRQPPSNFAEKVLSKVRRSERRRTSRNWVAAAALILLMIGGGVQIQHQRAESERAKEQLMVALRITSSKLQAVQERLNRIQQRSFPTQVNP